MHCSQVIRGEKYANHLAISSQNFSVFKMWQFFYTNMNSYHAITQKIVIIDGRFQNDLDKSAQQWAKKSKKCNIWHLPAKFGSTVA